MGLTERHWFEDEDVPENNEWALEDAVYNSRTNKKYDDDIVRCKDCKHQDPDRFDDGEGNYVCRKGHGWKPDNWFCADGEKR